MKKQVYVVRKYIVAKSAQEAIRLDRKTPVMDVWVEDGAIKEAIVNSLKEKGMGF